MVYLYFFLLRPRLNRASRPSQLKYAANGSAAFSDFGFIELFFVETLPVADGVRRVTHDDRGRTLSEFTGMNHDDLFNFREGENQDILRFGNTSEFKQPAHVFSQF